VRPALVLVLALAGTACRGTPEQDATVLLSQYFSALQAGEEAAIAALLDDCRDGRDCAGDIASVQASVSAQRELDAYTFEDPWGFGLGRALVLGAGGFWRLDAIAPTGDAEGVEHYRATLTARTQYNAAETRGLPSRAVIEYLVAPLGTVRRLGRNEKGPGALRDQLVEVQLEARLTKRQDGWRVADVRVLADTAVFEQVTWRPE
jgi:hypothetical protein